MICLTTKFYVGHNTKQKELELDGDAGSVRIVSFQDFHTPVEFAELGKPYQADPNVREPFQGLDWGHSVAEIANAISENRPRRSTGAQPAHFVTICNAIMPSVREGLPVDVTSIFPALWPMEWEK